MMNIARAIALQAQVRPDAPALASDRLMLTHGELESATARAAEALVRLGMMPGDVIGISMKTSPLHLLVILALARAGAVSVHVHPRYPFHAREAVIRNFAVTAVVVDPGGLAPEGCSQIEADPSWLEPGPSVRDQIAAGGDRTWRISLSSGTTGAQKGILRTHAASLAYLEQHATLSRIDARGRFLCHRGLDALLALYPCLLHLLSGAAVVIPASLGFGGFIEAIDRHRVTQLVMSPAFLRDLLLELPACTNRFPSVEHLLVGGSALSPALIEETLVRLTPNLHAGYGASETGRLSMAVPDTLRRVPQSVGTVVSWAQAEVVDDANRPLSPETPGVLRFRSALFPREYHRNPEATARSFRGGWFYPGDTGRLGPDGLLYIDSRLDDTINLDGFKVEPSEIEQALARHPAVMEAAAFGAAFEENRTGLFAAVKTRSAVEERVLLEHCRRLLGPLQAPARVFFVNELPRNEAGKVLRGELSARVIRKKPTPQA